MTTLRPLTGNLLVGTALLLGTLLTGCQPIAYSCADVRAQDPSAGDGEYEIDVNLTTTRLYCRDMATNPTEYLPLARNVENAGPEYNFSSYGAGANTTPGGVTTWYTKVRLRLDTLSIDARDRTFAVDSGGSFHHGDVFESGLPYGHAADCAASWGATGRGNIDLSGTPFSVLPDQFQISGYETGGSIVQDGPQIVNLTGGGFCGGAGPIDDIIYLGL